MPTVAELKEWYVDQAPENGGYVNNYYLPEGIRRLDRKFCRRISALSGSPPHEDYPKDTPEQIRVDILRCPHLHAKIKENLFLNLRRAISEREKQC